jgi:hypothetical protein
MTQKQHGIQLFSTSTTMQLHALADGVEFPLTPALE